MSGNDRTRDFRRNRKYSSNREEREEKHFKRPVILTKAKESDQSSSKLSESPIQPTIILKTREGENRAISPNLQTTPTKPKRDADSSPAYQLAPKSTPIENASLVFSPTLMKNSVKLLDPNTMQICDGLLEYLTDQTDFLVVGCLGLQGVGKSTIMSHLSSLPSTLPGSTIFKLQSKENIDTSEHCTEGIDAYITQDRVILLDSQPILSLSVLNKSTLNNECSRNSNRDDSEFPVVENDMEIQSLQYAAFILSVCHVVLFVQDWVFDPDLMRFLQAAEMLKPPTPTPTEDEELVEYFPHVMLLHTKVKSSYFSRGNIRDMQEAYRSTFATSNLQVQSGMGIANGSVTTTLNATLCDGEPLNMYLLPSFEPKDTKNKHMYRGHMGYTDLIKKLRQQIYGVALTPLSHTILTEKNWWHYAVKILDGIKKSTYFSELSRHMPTASSVKTDLNSL